MFSRNFLLDINTFQKASVIPFFPMAQKPLVGQGLLIIEASRLHSDTPHSVVHIWTSGQPYRENFTWQHTTLTREKRPWPRRDSNP
jgi:hypothetical protein